MSQPNAVITFSDSANEADAAADTAQQLQAKAHGEPIQGGILYSTVEHDVAGL